MAKILAVDDSPSIRRLVSMTLQQAGHDVESAEDGAEALNKAKAGNYDVVITDVHMPVMDGITFTRELRKLNHCRFIPVLVLTTESASEMKMQGKNAGATGWIVKPFNPDSLNRVLDRVLDPGRS
ncbi:MULTISPECIES: response regulator [Spongiibacter]|mgnify:CR=1 FL=1|jgi:two-component system chemotaxis response regulator CheY|uniref:response regulator n=1 Tax=Spongiibacter TaxID=630749 RepID=UPI0003B6A4A1|nr:MULTISPECIES: response regulator [Spongiibacter]MAY39532.1 response regulator [Spongiibacter sp.]MBI58586.1 response regulator [Spongiibacter sp.]MBO6754035.1 response regulator [Spongiibacter sp.]MBU71356.1 response regulator [Spongiibacter sp.]|tara:strand:- start:7324 stop:7698 length:375 start_codon:yes stop_codon:yes gene_type:complete